MAQRQLLPVDEWMMPIWGTDEVILRDPTGDMYSANAIPTWMGRTGLNYLMENGHRINVTLLYGMQREAADMCAPEELEALTRTATLFGDTAILGPASQHDSYARHNDAFVSRSARRFDSSIRRSSEDGPMLDAIQDAIQQRHMSSSLFDRDLQLFADNESARHEMAVRTAAGALLMNTADWQLLQHVGESLQEMDRGEPQHVVLSLSPIYMDVARKAGQILGLCTDVRCTRENSWPLKELHIVRVLQSAMSNGTFRLTAALQPQLKAS